MRKELTFTVASPGRDQGKAFLLREMSAMQAEKWAMRAFLALARAGVDIPTSVAGAGFAGIAALGVTALSGLSFADAEPLMDEMFGCISIKPDPRNPQVVRSLVEEDIEEVRTRLELRREVLRLHVDFFPDAFQPTSRPTSPMTPGSPNT